MRRERNEAGKRGSQLRPAFSFTLPLLFDQKEEGLRGFSTLAPPRQHEITEQKVMVSNLH